MADRYMPQDVFNLCVIVGAMALVTGNDATLDQALATYRTSYPSETDRLKPDAMDCAKSVRDFVVEKWPAPLDMSSDDRIQYHFRSLTMLYQELIKRKDAGNPFWKRVFGGSWFNYSPVPIPERRHVAYRTILLIMIELERKAILGR